MKFHEGKTVVLAINEKNIEQRGEVKLGPATLKYVKKCKYLGDILTERGEYNATIEDRENSITGTTAELNNIMSEISDSIEIKAVVQYTHGILMPKLLLNTETWSNMTNQNMTTMEKIQSQAIKRLLRIPYTTPTKGLLYELGMLSVENEIIKRRLMFMHRTLSMNHE